MVGGEETCNNLVSQPHVAIENWGKAMVHGRRSGRLRHCLMIIMAVDMVAGCSVCVLALNMKKFLIKLCNKYKYM